MLVSALGWMSDELAVFTQAPDEEPVVLAWGRSIAEDRPEYERWILEWERHRHRSEQGGTAPDEAVRSGGPMLSVVLSLCRPRLWSLRMCLASLLEQGYSNWELCLRDDGSGDRRLTELLDELAESDARVRVSASGDTVGLPAATNTALSSASGEYVVLLDPDDVLASDALLELARAALSSDDADVVYADDDRLDGVGRRFMPHFKPDWDPDLLLTFPYLGSLIAVRRTLFDSLGGYRPGFDGSSHYDLVLRATEQARRVVHVPKVLCHRRSTDPFGGAPFSGTAGSAIPVVDAGNRRAVEAAVTRRGIQATVVPGPAPGTCHVRRDVGDAYSVGAIIPFRDQGSLTERCLGSILGSRDGIDDIVLVDNGSSEPESWALRHRWQRLKNVRLLDFPGPFNWSAINNAAAATCTSDLLLFLNNDIEAVGADWLGAMIEHAQRPEVGAVGARLVYPDGTLQHAGTVMGLLGAAGHLFVGMPPGETGYFLADRTVRAYSAVTAACMLVRRSVFEEMGGFDENLAVAYNDVDFCLRLGEAGYRVLYTPHAELIHRESITRGLSGSYGTRGTS